MWVYIKVFGMDVELNKFFTEKTKTGKIYGQIFTPRKLLYVGLENWETTGIYLTVIHW